jgi:Na+-transporting NADH:ubiquinone oxidoreductase subunit NqrA
MVEAVRRGERAVLKEVLIERTKGERNRLLRYNVPGGIAANNSME